MDSKDNSITTSHQRQLLEITRYLSPSLTDEEFINIFKIYQGVIEREMRENND